MGTSPAAELGGYLRSRRARLSPVEAGLAAGVGRRRVAGLRREELAALAGVSVEYYTRLEQGRTARVSDEILDAVGGALRLDGTERDHLRRLVRATAAGRPRRSAAPQRVRAGVLELLGSMADVPAMVLGRRMEILAANQLHEAILDVPSPVRHVFGDPSAREFYPEWAAVAAETVGYLRLDAGRHPDDPALAALIGELSLRSPEFAALWATHDVRDKTHGVKQILHPGVGPLTLRYETLALPGDPDQLLVTYTAEPGSPTAERLRLLASWSATDRPSTAAGVSTAATGAWPGAESMA
jgi:transcriptional regulator with XRE-family HTH domain